MGKLFESIRIGQLNLSHRVVLAPLTRLRSNMQGVPPVIAAEYYAQRASTPGTLLIAEGTLIAPRAAGFPHSPGIWTKEQIQSWKNVVDAVHEKRSYIFLQLGAMGRSAVPSVLEGQGLEYIAPSAIQLSGAPVVPRAMTKDEIQEHIQFFVTAAKNAVEGAGFDGVELHGANGFLLSQFLSDVTNVRDDEYGGSVEGRSKFNLDLIDALSEAIGPERVGYRMSPWTTYGDLRMKDATLRETYTYFVSQLRDQHPNLAYLHAIEPRIVGDTEMSTDLPSGTIESNDFIREIWSPRPFISAGGYTRAKAIDVTERWPNQLVAFGRHFIANPDLPRRLVEDLALNPYDRSTFYSPGDDSPKGYTDYPFVSVS